VGIYQVMEKITDVLRHPARIKAIAVLLFLVAVHSLSGIEKNGLPITITGFVFSIIYIPFIIILIVFIRGDEKKIKVKKTDVMGELGVWGYIWRTYVISSLSVVLTGLFLKVFFGISFSENNIPVYINFYILMLFFMPITTWLVFSSDRKNQFMLVIKSVRGY
jgi:hypothetical protein